MNYNAMKPSLVSVIIPAHNAERFIKATLDCVFDQTYRPIEVIVVDDGSKDMTVDIVEGYDPGAYPDGVELVCVRQKNSGPSRARNTGIGEALGKYIAFLDSDDLWPLNKLSSQVALMEAHPEAGLVFGDVQRFSDDRGPRPSMFANKGLGPGFFGDGFYVVDPFKKLLECNYIPTGTVMLRRECFEAAGLFDEGFRYVEDLEFWYRVAARFRVGYSMEVWEYKRDHDGNVSNNNEAMQESYIRVLEKLEREMSGFISDKGLDLGSYFSRAYQRLGYICRGNNSPEKARRCFRKSFSYTPKLSTAFYWFSTFAKRSVSGGNTGL